MRKFSTEIAAGFNILVVDFDKIPMKSPFHHVVRVYLEKFRNEFQHNIKQMYVCVFADNIIIYMHNFHLQFAYLSEMTFSNFRLSFSFTPRPIQ